MFSEQHRITIPFVIFHPKQARNHPKIRRLESKRRVLTLLNNIISAFVLEVAFELTHDTKSVYAGVAT